jgi:hypothetical protein
MLCTVSVGCCVAPAGVPVVGLIAVEADVVDPVICTSCPTCALSYVTGFAPWRWLADVGFGRMRMGNIGSRLFQCERCVCGGDATKYVAAISSSVK